VIVAVDELLSFYADNTAAAAANVTSDVAPRRHAPAPTQPELVTFEPSDGLSDLSAIARTGADGMSTH